jgi:hypothetical protein
MKNFDDGGVWIESSATADELDESKVGKQDVSMDDEEDRRVGEEEFPWDDIGAPDDSGDYRNTDIKTASCPFTFSTSIMTARQLEGRVYPMPKWIILDVLPQGITLLAGDPKVGKTRLATNIALAVALGEKVLGVLDCRKMGVLCLFLEDPPRRVQERLRDLLPGDEAWPDNLYIATEWQKDTAGLEELDDFLTHHPEVGLVIVDVLERIRPLFVKGSVYQYDYQTIATLKSLSDKHNVGILIVHHASKDERANVFKRVSGTQGLTGAADTVMVLERDSYMNEEAIFSIIGREVEPAELALEHDPDTGKWTLLGDASLHMVTDERKEVFGYLEQYPWSKPKEVAAGLGRNHNSTKGLLRRMLFAGQLVSDGKGGYAVAPRE